METQQLLSSVVLPSVPVMEAGRFAELVGVSHDVVRGWIEKGYLPTVRMGRYRLVNIAVLTREALQEGSNG
ncbi:MAG TPA: hypothetical protein PK893_04260 [Candidatus Competibacteraceae bacterium]|nr:hypothetical protein [Candidatus Competibacteraceae bacterium]HQD55403.1 hypothetical protein [Candidatus Competibacteraceae bacterium]